MVEYVQREWTRLRGALAETDMQTAVVLTAAALLVILQFTLGDRQLFLRHFADAFPPEWHGVLAWGWWFGMQGILGFVVPVFILTVGFRQSGPAIGLGWGDWRLAGTLAGLYVPLVAIGTWVLSDGTDFQRQYPHYQPAARDWMLFATYEALFLFYWIGWEYLWRGFVLFGTARTLGRYAIFVQAVPFAALHINKPVPEALLSVVGGIALGALVWRCRAFWIAVPIHAAQMLLLDLWCSLRIRTGADGIGFSALWTALGG
jgi:hypothetical protein